MSEAEDVLAMLTGLMIARRTTPKDATTLSSNSSHSSSSSNGDSIKLGTNLAANDGDFTPQVATMLATPPKSSTPKALLIPSAATSRTAAANTSGTSYSSRADESAEGAVDLGLSPEEVKGYQLRTAQCRAHENRADTPPSASPRLQDEQRQRDEINHEGPAALSPLASSPRHSVSRRLHLDSANAHDAPPSRRSLVFWAVVYFVIASILAAGIGYGVFLHMLYTNGASNHHWQPFPNAYSARPPPPSRTNEEHLGASERHANDPPLASPPSAISPAAVPLTVENNLKTLASAPATEQYAAVVQEQEVTDAEANNLAAVEEESAEDEKRTGVQRQEADVDFVAASEGAKEDDSQEQARNAEDSTVDHEEETEEIEKEQQPEEIWDAQASSSEEIELGENEGQEELTNVHHQQDKVTVPLEAEVFFEAKAAAQESSGDDEGLALEDERADSSLSTPPPPPPAVVEAGDSATEEPVQIEPQSARAEADEMAAFEARKREVQLQREAGLRHDEVAFPSNATTSSSLDAEPSVAEQDSEFIAAEFTVSPIKEEPPAVLLERTAPEEDAPAPLPAAHRRSKPVKTYPTGFLELEAEMAEMLEADRREREAEVVGGAEHEDGEENEESSVEEGDGVAGATSEDGADANDDTYEIGSASSCEANPKPTLSLSRALLDNEHPNAEVKDQQREKNVARSNDGASAAAAPAASAAASMLHVGPIAPDDRERQAAARAAAAEARALTEREEQERQAARAARHKARRREAEAQRAREEAAAEH